VTVPLRRKDRVRQRRRGGSGGDVVVREEPVAHGIVCPGRKRAALGRHPAAPHLRGLGFAFTLGFEHPGDLPGARMQRREDALPFEVRA
jgi:hypothetical protein